jgi:hypothetical protein
MSLARILAVVAVIASGVAAYAVYEAISIGFVQAIAGSGAQAMDELRFRPDYAEIRAAQEKLAMEDSRRKERFKNLAGVSAFIAIAAAGAALGKAFDDRKRRAAEARR